ncbi:hypothetical protein [Nocardia camponoti]|uniref:hypothetical protein n=1 Tax=Nocardia camponoti TaxID=1616106 RepID=UPI001662A783|nr:hypothetical protein [Nocardia camponoti]
MGDKTAWDGAASKATIRVETGAALKAANACRDMIAVLKGCKDALAPGKLNNYSVAAIGGDEVHAGPLRSRFIEETTQAYDTVGKFIDALQDMTDMFKDAGALYTGNDTLSASELATLNSNKTALSGVSKEPPASSYKDAIGKAPWYMPPHFQLGGGHDDDIELAKKPSTPKLGKAEEADIFGPHARSPKSMGWKDLQALGQRIDWWQVAGDMPTWQTLATEVDKAGTAFQSGIRTITKDNWESNGGDAAFTAVQGFVKSIGELRDGFTMMHSALQYFVDFLHATEVSMPVPANGETCDDVSEVQDLYKDHYYNGFDEVQKMYPVAAVPSVPKGALGPPPPEKGKEKPEDPGKRGDGTGGNGQGGGSGSGSGAGSGGQSGSQGGGGGSQNAGAQDRAAQDKAAQDKAAQDQQQQQVAAVQKQREALAKQQQELDKQKQNAQGAGNQGATGGTGTGPTSGSAGAAKGTSGSSGSSNGNSDLSSLISAISGVVSSVTQSLPSLIEALAKIDVSAMTPDLTELTKTLAQFPDLRTAIVDSPQFAQVLADKPELVPVAQTLGLTPTNPITQPVAAAPEPVTAFPRATLPDFTNLGSDIVSPLVAASADAGEAVSRVAREVADAATAIEQRRSAI